MRYAVLDSSYSYRAQGDVLVVLDYRTQLWENPVGLGHGQEYEPSLLQSEQQPPKPDFVDPLSGEKLAGDWNTTEKILVSTLWVPQAVWRID